MKKFIAMMAVLQLEYAGHSRPFLKARAVMYLERMINRRRRSGASW